MNYYIRETVFDEVRNRTAASKAREDINEIAESMGFTPVDVEYDYSLRKSKGFFAALWKLTRDWSDAITGMGDGDTVLIQYPLNHHPMGIPGLLKKYRARGGKVIFLIHDLDCLRMKRKTPLDKLKHAKVIYEDNSILKCGDAVIGHNNKMNKILVKMGIDKDKLIPLRIFDYLVHGDFQYTERKVDDPIVVAGTLRQHKAGYAYNLPEGIDFNLYGVGYENEEKEGVQYFGSFNPEELTQKMEGSFGLIWDGTTSETCDGISGNYIKLNNPHKLSLYLASGLPVVVWDQAAVADFVGKEKVGFAVGNIAAIKDVTSQISEDSYREMVENARKISGRLLTGSYARSALNKALDITSGQGK